MSFLFYRFGGLFYSQRILNRPQNECAIKKTVEDNNITNENCTTFNWFMSLEYSIGAASTVLTVLMCSKTLIIVNTLERNINHTQTQFFPIGFLIVVFIKFLSEFR